MTLTDFLIMLESPSLRKEYRDNNRRPAMLQRFGLQDHPALQPSATLQQMQDAVAAENLGGLTRIELWIRAGAVPVANDGFDSSTA